MNATNPPTGGGTSGAGPGESVAQATVVRKPADRKVGRRTPRTRRARTVLLPELLAAAVERNPDSTALVCGAASLSYRELDARSSPLARVLVQ